jgi:hypothetical protein
MTERQLLKLDFVLAAAFINLCCRKDTGVLSGTLVFEHVETNIKRT